MHGRDGEWMDLAGGKVWAEVCAQSGGVCVGQGTARVSDGADRLWGGRLLHERCEQTLGRQQGRATRALSVGVFLHALRASACRGARVVFLQ